MKVIKTQVVIVGAGPVGLGMAVELDQRGVTCVLVEQSDGTIEHPRTGLVAVRTMELFRRWDIVPAVRDCGFPKDYELSMVFCTALNGLLLDREHYPSMRDAPTPSETPEKKQRCPQMWLQPIMAEKALSSQGVTPLFQHRFTHFELNAECVHVYTKNLLTQEEVVIEAAYLVACDGANSPVRQQLGIEMEGRLLSYSVNILLRIPDLVRQHAMGEAERYMFVGPQGMWGNLTVVDGKDIWRLTVLGSRDKMNLDTFDARGWVLAALGTADQPTRIPFEILSVVPWRRSEMLATKFVEGRVILAGDSAHTMSPTGGMGMNTGMQEVLDLGWKLQGVLEGWAETGLLESYGIERRPIAARNISFSTQNFQAWQDTPDPQAVCDQTEEGAKVRAKLGMRLRNATRVEWESMGLQIGHRYEDSPICVPDGTEPTPDDFKDYVGTTRPGARAPHLWLDDGRSTLDLFGAGFVLLILDENVAEAVDALVSAFAARRVPLQLVSIRQKNVQALYAYKLVLVRPDGHVGWRGNTVPNAISIVDTLRGSNVNVVTNP